MLKHIFAFLFFNYFLKFLQWAGKTIALGTFPPAEAEEKCLRAKELTRTWRLTMKPKPSREWVMAELERLQIRVVSGRLGRRTNIESQTPADENPLGSKASKPPNSIIISNVLNSSQSCSVPAMNPLYQQRNESTSSDNSKRDFPARDSITASLLSAAYLAREGDDNLLSGLAFSARNSLAPGANAGNSTQSNEPVNLDLAYSLLQNRRYSTPDGIGNIRQSALGSVNLRDSLANGFESRRSTDMSGMNVANFQEMMEMMDRKEYNGDRSSMGSIDVQDKILADLNRRRMSSIFQDLIGVRESDEILKRKNFEAMRAAKRTDEIMASNGENNREEFNDNIKTSIEAALEEVRKNNLTQQLNEHLQNQGAQKVQDPTSQYSARLHGDDPRWSKKFEVVRKSSLDCIDAAIEEARRKGQTLLVPDDRTNTGGSKKFNIEAALDEIRQTSIKTQLNENLQKHVMDKSNSFRNLSVRSSNGVGSDSALNGFSTNPSDSVSDSAALHSNRLNYFDENRRSSESTNLSRAPSGMDHQDGRRAPSGVDHLEGRRAPSGMDHLDGRRAPLGMDHMDGGRYSSHSSRSSRYSHHNEQAGMCQTNNQFTDIFGRENENRLPMQSSASEQFASAKSLNLNPAQTYEMLKQHHKKLMHEMNETARMMRIFHQSSGLPFDPYLAAVNGGNSENLLGQLLNEQKNVPQSLYCRDDNPYGPSSSLHFQQRNTSNSSGSRQFVGGIHNNNLSLPERSSQYSKNIHSDSNSTNFSVSSSNNLSKSDLAESSLNRTTVGGIHNNNVSQPERSSQYSKNVHSDSNSTKFHSGLSSNNLSKSNLSESSLNRTTNSYTNSSLLRQFGNLPRSDLSIKRSLSNDTETISKKLRVQKERSDN